MQLKQVVDDVADAIVSVDSSGQPFRGYQVGVGPYGEPQLLGLIATHLNSLPFYQGAVRTQRTPDLLIAGSWAIEFKIARPFGDNNKVAENWSVNLLHPYEGNVSTIGDCLKLLRLDTPERKAVCVIGYEHSPAQIDLMPLVQSFELIAREVVSIELSERVETKRDGLVHPVHQAFRVFAWEVLGRAAS